MRRALLVLSASVLLLPAPAVLAKFGITKTHVVLPRLRPPETPLLAETVAVEVHADAPEVRGAYVDLVRDRLEGALRAGERYRLAERARDAEAVVRVVLEDLRAEVRDEIKLESKRVKIGEKKEWDEKKKKEVTKDVYGYRDEPVPYRVVEGALTASLEARESGRSRRADVGAAYHDRFRADSQLPLEARSEENLRHFLVDQSAARAAAAVTFSPDPVEALLAVNGELKDGNRLAEAGLFREALGEWERRLYQGDSEAARVHNVGVAHEALAYRLPPEAPEHAAELEKARDCYQRALSLDPSEKYFREPLPRIEVSLGYAAAARDLKAELDRARAQTRKEAEPAAPPVRAEAPLPAAPAPPSHSAARREPAALRNGSFESSLAPWTTRGRATLRRESGHGSVLEVDAGSGPAALTQSLSLAVAGGRQTLSVQYRVVAGEGHVRAQISYRDAQGKERRSVLEVTGGEGAGGWAAWTSDLAALRPRPAELTELSLLVEGGTVRLDDVTLSSR